MRKQQINCSLAIELLDWFGTFASSGYTSVSHLLQFNIHETHTFVNLIFGSV